MAQVDYETWKAIVAVKEAERLAREAQPSAPAKRVFHAYEGVYTDSNDGYGPEWDASEHVGEFSSAEEAQAYADALNRDDPTSEVRVFDEPKYNVRGTPRPQGPAMPSRREIPRGPNRQEGPRPESVGVRHYGGQLPGAPPPGGLQKRLNQLTGGVIRPGRMEVAPGERYSMASDLEVRRNADGTLTRVLPASSFADGGRPTVLGSANAARAQAELAALLQSSSEYTEEMADPRWIRQRDEAGREALNALGDMPGVPFEQTPVVGGRAGQFMELLGAPPELAKRLAVYEYRLGAAGLGPRTIEAKMAEALSASGALAAIEGATELNSQTLGGVRSEIVQRTTSDDNTVLGVFRDGVEVPLPGGPQRIPGNLQFAYGVPQALPEQPWDNPNDPGARVTRPPLRQLTGEETALQARFSTRPSGGGRDPFDKEPGRLPENPYGVPLVVGRATETIMEGKRPDRRPKLSPAYEQAVRDAERAERIAAATKGVIVEAKLPGAGSAFYTSEATSDGGRREFATGERLQGLVDAAGGEITRSVRSPEWIAARQRVDALLAAPQYQKQTPTTLVPRLDEAYEVKLKELSILAQGNPNAPVVQKARADLAALAESPVYDVYGDSGNVVKARAWSPEALGAVVLNPGARLPSDFGYDYMDIPQGPSDDGGLGSRTGVPVPNDTDLSPDRLAHGFSDRDDPGRRGEVAMPATLASAALGEYYEGRTPIHPGIIGGPRATIAEVVDKKTGKTRYFPYLGDRVGGIEPRVQSKEAFPLYGQAPRLNADGDYVADFRMGERTELTNQGKQAINALVSRVLALPVSEGGLGMSADVIPAVNQRLTDRLIGEIQNEVLDSTLPDGAFGKHRSATWNVIEALKAGAGAGWDGNNAQRLVELPGSPAASAAEQEVGRRLVEHRQAMSARNVDAGMPPLPPPDPRQMTRTFGQAASAAIPGASPADAVTRRIMRWGR